MSYYGITIQQLKILSLIETDEKYGYQILKELDDQILLGSLYNSLKSLERKGFVKSRWGDEINQAGRRKYYRITAEGQNCFDTLKGEMLTNFGLTSI
ncbi:PadR family transcriptional regulator [Flagellimonas eckloniae]|uniref:Transcription regulator PadR N-terminal domain-containing protein n=1 Tax=Flagellimonas eckloniae TaxID=346185 RepID=A0A0Q1C282_9FLAO|nr:PadR family transcriptional regulator [Allomuricauda eckloniae]KQC31346.1 hypothetical protein AAY42_16730 [Allomuricauda eckloniae]